MGTPVPIPAGDTEESGHSHQEAIWGLHPWEGRRNGGSLQGCSLASRRIPACPGQCGPSSPSCPAPGALVSAPSLASLPSTSDGGRVLWLWLWGVVGWVLFGLVVFKIFSCLTWSLVKARLAAWEGERCCPAANTDCGITDISYSKKSLNPIFCLSPPSLLPLLPAPPFCTLGRGFIVFLLANSYAFCIRGFLVRKERSNKETNFRQN